MALRVRVNSKHQITVPASVREELHIESGDYLLVEIRDGHLVLMPEPRDYSAHLRGLHPRYGKELSRKNMCSGSARLRKRLRCDGESCYHRRLTASSRDHDGGKINTAALFVISIPEPGGLAESIRYPKAAVIIGKSHYHHRWKLVKQSNAMHPMQYTKATIRCARPVFGSHVKPNIGPERTVRAIPPYMLRSR